MMSKDASKPGKPGDTSGVSSNVRSLTPTATLRKAVLVLGMHRSGTSALTRTLNHLGCDAPKTLMAANSANPAGYWESRPISNLNDQILESGGSHWSDWQEFNPNWIRTPVAEGFANQATALLQQEYDNSRLFVLKDPRISLLMPFWRGVFERADIETVAIISMRHPMEVSASLAKREGFEVARSLLIWLRYMLDAEKGSRGMNRYFTSYDQLMHDSAAMIAKSEQALDSFWPRKSDRVLAEIADQLSESLRHHTLAADRFKEPPYAAPWVRQVYELFQKWVQIGEVSADCDLLDTLRAEVAMAGPPFRRIVVELDSSASEVKRLTAELAAAETLQKREEAKAADLSKALDERQRQIVELEARLAARNKEVEKLASNVRDHAEAAETLQQEVNQAQSAAKQKVAALVAELGEKSAALKAAESAAAKLRAAKQAGLLEIAARTRDIANRDKVIKLTDDKLTKAKRVLAQTENELRQRDHEAEQTSLALSRATGEIAQLKVANASTQDELQRKTQLLQEQERTITALDQVRTDLEAEIRVRFDEIAVLTQAMVAGDELSEQVSKVVETLLTLPKRRYLSKRKIQQRQAALLYRSGLFDPAWYQEQNPDVAASGVDPVAHFVRYGHAEGRAPCKALAKFGASMSLLGKQG